MSMRLFNPVLTVLACFGFVACGGDSSGAERVLRVTAIPDSNPDQLRAKAGKLQDWLSASLGVKVLVTPVLGYSAAVAAVVSGKADLAWLGGVTTVLAMRESRGEVQPLITRASDLEFKSYFIVGAGIEAKTLEDLRGKSFTFGDMGSTSGRVMPQFFMRKEFGINDPAAFFSSVAFSGAHDLTAAQVANGTVDAGVLNYKTYDDLVAAGKLDKAKARVLWTTPAFVDYAWVARTDIDAGFGDGFTARLRSAFLDLDVSKAEDKAILDLQSCRQFVRADPAAWDGIKSVLETVDVTK